MNPIKSGFVLIIIGFAIVVIGTLISAQKADFGGLILIGPIPIAFGTSPEITFAAMAIGLVMMLVSYALGRRNA